MLKQYKLIYIHKYICVCVGYLVGFNDSSVISQSRSTLFLALGCLGCLFFPQMNASAWENHKAMAVVIISSLETPRDLDIWGDPLAEKRLLEIHHEMHPWFVDFIASFVDLGF